MVTILRRVGIKERFGRDFAYVRGTDELKFRAGTIETPHPHERTAEKVVAQILEESDGSEPGVGQIFPGFGSGDDILLDIEFAGKVRDWSWVRVGVGAAIRGCEDDVFDAGVDGGLCYGFAFDFFSLRVRWHGDGEETPWVFDLLGDADWVVEVALDYVDV